MQTVDLSTLKDHELADAIEAACARTSRLHDLGRDTAASEAVEDALFAEFTRRQNAR